MGNLKTKIKEFLKIEYDFGYGSGTPYGYGHGHGYGSGYGHDDCSGWGYGYDPDSLYGYGSGYGYGYGSGSSYGYDICNDPSADLLKFNEFDIYSIDGVPTIITNIKNNFAKGAIVNKDFTLTPCYIVKGHNLFAHGETLKKALEDLQDKIFDELDVDERIKEFNKIFKPNQKYKGHEFYKWHTLLTGSCELGKKAFIKNNNINLDDEFTVKEFIDICKNTYGGEIISRLIKEEKE